MKSIRPQLQRQDLCLAEKMLYLAKMNPPKKFREAGFSHGRKAEMILFLHRKEKLSQAGEFRGWFHDSKGLMERRLVRV